MTKIQELQLLCQGYSKNDLTDKERLTILHKIRNANLINLTIETLEGVIAIEYPTYTTTDLLQLVNKLLESNNLSLLFNFLSGVTLTEEQLSILNLNLSKSALWSSSDYELMDLEDTVNLSKKVLKKDVESTEDLLDEFMVDGYKKFYLTEYGQEFLGVHKEGNVYVLDEPRDDTYAIGYEFKSQTDVAIVDSHLDSFNLNNPIMDSIPIGNSSNIIEYPMKEEKLISELDEDELNLLKSHFSPTEEFMYNNLMDDYEQEDDHEDEADKGYSDEYIKDADMSVLEMAEQIVKEENGIKQGDDIFSKDEETDDEIDSLITNLEDLGL